MVAEACIGRSGYVTSLRHMPKTVILGAARTPIGKLGGGLSTIDATELGATAITAALERADVAPDQVQHVVMGQVLQAGQGQIPSRQAQIKAGIPKEVSSETINKVCASGLRASVLLDQAIRAGDVEVGVGGGMESMSRAPYLLPQARFGFRMGDAKALDAMVHDGLTNPFSGRQMFDEATEIGDELELTRPDLDRWALRSHERAVAATDEGRLPEEIVAGHRQGTQGRHRRRGRRGPAPRHEPRDAGQAAGPRGQGGLAHGGQLARSQRRRRGARAGQRRVGLGQRQGGPGRDRGPRAVGQRLRLPRHHAGARRGEGAGQGRAVGLGHRPVGDQRGLRLGGAQLDQDARHRRGASVNVNGGAVALGHPIGASGARILGALVHELRRRGGGLGCAAICSGGGQGDAVILKVRAQRGVTHDVTPQEEVAQVPVEHGRGAAFFDLDRTLMAGSSGLYWARAARGAGLLTRRRIARYGWENVKFRLRGSTDQATDRVRREVGEMISGQRVVDLQRLAPKVLAGVLPRLYPQMLEVAHAHQDAGRPVYICTAASQEMAEMLAHVLSFDGALGARSEVVDGRYTGRSAGPFTYREGKSVAMRELAAAEGIDLAASYAYSDSESDLPMLRTVGHPVVVNPDAELRRVAREEGWEIMRFEQLGRRLKAAAAFAFAALVGTGARTVAVRKR